MSSSPMRARPGFGGAARILRFNWPTYAVAATATLACLAGLARTGPWSTVAAVGLVLTLWWTVASIVVSHWVYDRSPLAEWSALSEWLPPPHGRWLIVQAGFDASRGRLRALLSGEGEVVDLGGSPGVGGASVRRARNEDAGRSRADAGALPEGTAIRDTVLSVFTLHEIRNAPAREGFFRATARALAPGGRLLVVEHLRDWRNFLVYGPGFLHFLPESEWRRCASLAALELEREIAVTPFVRVFLWRTPTRTSGGS